MTDKPKTRWHYRTMRFVVVEKLFHAPKPKDAYTSRDENVEALDEILGEGFRWVRTDYPPDDWEIAVFEKEIEIP